MTPTHLATATLGALLTFGCVGGGGSSDGGGGGGDSDSGINGAGGGSGAPQCQTLGDPHPLPYATRQAIAPGPGGYVIALESGGFGTEEWTTHTLIDGALATHDDGVGRTPVALAGDDTTTVAIASGKLISQLALRRFDGTEWTIDDAERSEEFGQATDFSNGADIALGPAGQVAAIWVEGGFDDPYTAWVSRYTPGEGFAPREAAFTRDDGTEGPEVYAAFGPDGSLHTLAQRYDADDVRLMYRRRALDGTWTPIVDVASVPGLLSNIITGLAVTADGTAYAAATRGRFSGTADDNPDPGVHLYRLTDAAAEEVAYIPDDRLISSALAIAPLGDRVVIAATHGQNNFDAAESDDSVDVYACDADGCTAPLRVAPGPGVFYEAVDIATRGDEAAVLWAQSPKGDGDAPEADFVQRITCP